MYALANRPIPSECSPVAEVTPFSTASLILWRFALTRGIAIVVGKFICFAGRTARRTHSDYMLGKIAMSILPKIYFLRSQVWSQGTGFVFSIALFLGFILLPLDSASAQPLAQLAPDGRSFTMDAPGFAGFQASWFATIQRDSGPERQLTSENGQVTQGQVTSIFFPAENVELLFKLQSHDDTRAVVANAGIRNRGAQPVNLVSVTPIAATWTLPENLNGWFLTGLHPATAVVQALREIFHPVTIHEHGGCYHSSGQGFLFAPVGEPVAFVTGRLARFGAGKMYLTYTAEMSRVRVDPGQTRWGQQVVLWQQPPQKALPLWAKWTGDSHGARTSNRALTGWGSWYSFNANVTSKDILAQVDVVKKIHIA